MKLYNTLTRRVEDFVVEDGRVNMYVCGITPYAPSHLGHAMCAVVFDIVRRYLEFKGLEVAHIQNFTDIDDKMIAAAKEQGIEVSELAEMNIQNYLMPIHLCDILINESLDYKISFFYFLNYSLPCLVCLFI